jgi:hypothetical protein
MLYSLLFRDIFEMFFYSSCIFIFLKWLYADKSKELVSYFLGYCCLLIGAWVFELPTLFLCLLYNSSTIVLLFIVLHEKTLQRNFVTLYNPSLNETDLQDWLEIVMQSCLTSINANKPVTIIIEQKDSLELFLDNQSPVKAHINKHLLDILLLHEAYESDKMIWIDTKNNIKGFNTEFISTEKQKKGTLLFFSMQNDAIMLITDPLLRSFAIVFKGKKIENVSAYQTQLLIKKYLNVSHANKEIYYENNIDETFIS